MAPKQNQKIEVSFTIRTKSKCSIINNILVMTLDVVHLYSECRYKKEIQAHISSDIYICDFGGGVVIIYLFTFPMF